ncbi:StbB family protein [Pelomonas sp. KK5]|uniref:StbB family protein n=1 Tax=Pelomonas sp. KK5 TaxID=1855730 RepID=UPI00097CC04C|nr:StbB family protein [Pelomonas sp. KK5]
MKVAVLSFSGNVGKSTIARHLLAPRLPGSRVIAIESVNAGEDEDHVIRGRQFAELQEFMQLVDNVIVDIGASNVEDLLGLMRRYRGSHEDFDVFIVPAVAARKQQRDTMATLAELSRLGVPADKVRVVFNMVDERAELKQAFGPLLSFLQEAPLARCSLDACLELNEVYALMNGSGTDLRTVAADPTDYKAEIVAAPDTATRVSLARRLARRRLALGVLPALDDCFAALDLQGVEVPQAMPSAVGAAS